MIKKLKTNPGQEYNDGLDVEVYRVELDPKKGGTRCCWWCLCCCKTFEGYAVLLAATQE